MTDFGPWTEWKPGDPIPEGRGQVWRDRWSQEFAKGAEAREFREIPAWGGSYHFLPVIFYRRVIEPEWFDVCVSLVPRGVVLAGSVEAQIKNGMVIAVRMKE